MTRSLALLPLFLGLLVCGSPRLVAAEGPSALAELAEALRSEEPALRVEAAEHLRLLGREALPAIDARLEVLKKRVIDPEEGYQALRAFAHAAGSRRADDPLDIGPGVAARLEAQRPTPIEAAIAEELLLLRAIERLGSAEAYRRAPRIFGLHYDVFRWESRHSIKRVGMKAMPALLDAAAYGDAGMAEWATQSLAILGKPTPADALRALEGEDRAELLRVYAERRIMDAMESVAAFLDDPDPIVRKAAIASLRRYGRNAIWQIREAARLFFGEDLDRSWSAQQSLDHVLQKLEARRLAPQREALARAEELAERGELEAARELIDLVLAERPGMERRGVAARLYQRLAERSAERGDHAEAALLLFKASLIAPGEREREELHQASEEARESDALARGLFLFAPPEAGAGEGASADAPPPTSQKGAERRLPALLLALGAFLLVGVRPLALLLAFIARRARPLPGLARGIFLASARRVRVLGERVLAERERRRVAIRKPSPEEPISSPSPEEAPREKQTYETPKAEPRKAQPSAAPRLEPAHTASLPVELIFGAPKPRIHPRQP